MRKTLKLLVPTLLLAVAPALKADQPICQVFCVTTQCSQNSDCTAAPNGVCRLACPGVGCCVYQ